VNLRPREIRGSWRDRIWGGRGSVAQRLILWRQNKRRVVVVIYRRGSEPSSRILYTYICFWDLNNWLTVCRRAGLENECAAAWKNVSPQRVQEPMNKHNSCSPQFQVHPRWVMRRTAALIFNPPRVQRRRQISQTRTHFFTQHLLYSYI